TLVPGTHRVSDGLVGSGGQHRHDAGAGLEAERDLEVATVGDLEIGDQGQVREDGAQTAHRPDALPDHERRADLDEVHEVAHPRDQRLGLGQRLRVDGELQPHLRLQTRLARTNFKEARARASRSGFSMIGRHTPTSRPTWPPAMTNGSMTRLPSKAASSRAVLISFQGWRPSPGGLRSVSPRWSCRRCLPAWRMASPIEGSSMFMWKVSSRILQAGLATSST